MRQVTSAHPSSREIKAINHLSVGDVMLQNFSVKARQLLGDFRHIRVEHVANGGILVLMPGEVSASARLIPVYDYSRSTWQ